MARPYGRPGRPATGQRHGEPGRTTDARPPVGPYGRRMDPELARSETFGPLGPLRPGPVLVGVDDRPPAEAAVAAGAELAAHLGRELVLATIYEGHGHLHRARNALEADRR